MSPYKIMEVFTAEETQELLIASDGSAIDNGITYGWVLGTSHGRILTQHSGVGYGEPSSRRAESWGMLSGHRFIYHLERFKRVPIPITLPIAAYSDNKGLISRLTN